VRYRWADDLRRDIGYGFRALRRTPGFTAVAVLTLAVGIGAVTIIYSVLRNVVLDPFPYSRSDRLVNVLLKDASDRIVRGPYFAANEWLDYQEQAQVFEDVVGTSREGMYWDNGGGAELMMTAWMTPNGFDFLGVAPLIGRVFTHADAAPDAAPVAVMAHRTWVGRFGADPGVIGRTLVLNGQARTVIGVMPPRFEWNIVDLWLPDAFERSDDPRTPRGFRAFQAHLRPGVTPAEAEAQLNVIGARRAAQFPNDYPPQYRFQVIKVVDWVVRDFRGVLYTLFGAVSLLLVIACCNVANMLLARATTREREMSVRVALGASRGRIVRQLLVESGLLAIGGLVTGCALAYGGIQALAAFMPRQGVPWETTIRLDRPVLLFAAIVAAVATLSFGLFPAAQSARRDLASGVNAGGRGTSGPRQTRMRGGLVVAQVALSIVLLLGAGLLMRTFVKLAGVDMVFEPKTLLVAGLNIPPRTIVGADQQRQFYRDLLTRLETTPGVSAAAISSGVPAFGGMPGALEAPGTGIPTLPLVFMVFTSEGLTKAAGVPLVRGRELTAADVDRMHRVAVVNETLARKLFGEADPLGRAIRLPRLTTLAVPVTDPTFEIIGVVRDVPNQGPRELPAPQLYIPYGFRLPGGMGIAVRANGDPMRLVPTLRARIREADARVALVEPQTMDVLIQQSLARPRFSVLVLGIFAVTGLVLVALGVYGVLAYTVAQQTREIAIRMALGGERGHVLRMILRLGLQLVGAGLIVGLLASVATNRLLVSQLWNISPADPLTFATVIVLIVAIAAAACLVPARRAIQVEPMVALRHE
jgi:putative ABC transport system permease protein